MDRIVTGALIRRLRTEKGLTQAQLAERLFVSAKAVSKWETGKGFPDLAIIGPLASLLGVSPAELMRGADTPNANRHADMRRCLFHVCPECGNVITSVGGCTVSCCGNLLPALTPREPDEEHRAMIEPVEDEYYITLSHEMTKEHSIAFLASIGWDGLRLVRLYPEGNAEALFRIRGTQTVCWYCTRHGLFSLRVGRRSQK